MTADSSMIEQQENCSFLEELPMAGRKEVIFCSATFVITVLDRSALVPFVMAV